LDKVKKLNVKLIYQVEFIHSLLVDVFNDENIHTFEGHRVKG